MKKLAPVTIRYSSRYSSNPDNPDILRTVPVSEEFIDPILGRICIHHETAKHSLAPSSRWCATCAETGDSVSGGSWETRKSCMEETRRYLSGMTDDFKQTALDSRRRALAIRPSLPWSPPSPR